MSGDHKMVDLNASVTSRGSLCGAVVCSTGVIEGEGFGVHIGVAAVPGFSDRPLFIRVFGGEGGLMELLSADEAAALARILLAAAAAPGIDAKETMQ